MYCPECRCEHIEGYGYCKSCESRLVHQLDQEPTKEQPEDEPACHSEIL